MGQLNSVPAMILSCSRLFNHYSKGLLHPTVLY